MAVIFVITSLSYTYVTSSRPSSESTILNVKIEDTAAPAKSAAPVQTPAVPAQKAVPRPRTRAPHPPQSRRPRLWPRRARPPRPVRQPRPRELPANSFSAARSVGRALASALPQTYAYGRGASPCGRIFLGEPHSARPVRRVSWPDARESFGENPFRRLKVGDFPQRKDAARAEVNMRSTHMRRRPAGRQTLLRLLPQRPLKTRGTRSFFCGP